MNDHTGGVSSSIRNLLDELHKSVDVKLLTFEDRNLSSNQAEDWLRVIRNKCVSPFEFSAGLTSRLAAEDAYIFHTHGLWLHINHATCALARRRGVPYVITPHGMLYATALQRSAWKKRPLEWLMFRKDILSASAIHVTSPEELEQVRLYGYRGPVAVIPNAIQPIPENFKTQNDKPKPLTIGFMGRLHPIKQIEMLLRGAALAEIEDLKIEIIGDGDRGYKQFLLGEVSRLKLTKKVDFTGFVEGDEKLKHLSRLHALFLPSKMESFGMIVPEALQLGIAVMASTGTPWEALNQLGMGWWTDPTPQNIAAIIKELNTFSQTNWDRISSAGQQFVAQNFSPKTIAAKTHQFYQWLLSTDKSETPNFINLIND